MKNILNKTKNFLFENKILFAAFFVPVIMLFSAYALAGIYPFGEKSVLAVDFSTQYVYFFDYLHNVFSGKESLFYNWSGSLSGNFYTTFAYYIASPFNLITLLFPRENLTEGLLTLILLKAGLSGLFMAFFLRKHRRYSEFTSLLFALVYALCGYFAANTINPMWLDAVAFLPLIIAGAENIFKKRKFIMYVITLFIAIVSNFYIGFMLCVFSVLYFVCLMVSKKSARKKIKLGVFALSTASAGLMSGFIILPAFLPLFEGKLDGGFDRIEFRECFNILDGVLKFFPTVYDTQRYGGLPFLYCGLFTLIFAAAYFCCKKFPLRERITNGALCGFLMFSMYFKPLDNLWHGGRAPMWFEHRYSFVLIFMLIILAADAFENIRSVRLKHIGTAFLALLGILLIAYGFKTREFKNAEYIVLISILFLTAAGICAAAVKKSAKLPAKAVALALVCTELFVNLNSYVSDIDGDFVYQSRDEYCTQMKELREISDGIRAKDDGFYRVEKTYSRAFNDNIGAELYGVSFSSSAYNSTVLETMKKLGFGQYDWHTDYKGATMLMDDIFGIKYVISKDKSLVPYTEKDGTVYKNPDALPVAFLADKGVLGSIFAEQSPLDFQQDLASAISGQREEIFTKIYDYDFSQKNISVLGNRYARRSTGAEAKIMYTFTAPKSGAFYAHFPTENERACALYVNGKFLRNYFNGFYYSTAYLGNFSKGEKISVELKLYDNEVYFDAPTFAVVDEENLAKFTAAIPHNEVKKTSPLSLEVELNAGENSVLFTTIPFEKGWSAYVDGKKCEISTAVNGAFICVELPAGKHTVTLEFFPDGLSAGLALSVGGAALFGILIVLFAAKRKRRK